jgi:hypothetical protein
VEKPAQSVQFEIRISRQKTFICDSVRFVRSRVPAPEQKP